VRFRAPLHTGSIGNAFILLLDRNLTILEMEQTTTLNAGLDYGLFNNRLTGSVDLYKERLRIYCCTLKTHLSLVSNYDNYNVGTIENKGIELLAELFRFVLKILNGR
jgi:hypothetical protein